MDGGKIYLSEAAHALHVSFDALEKMLYRSEVSAQLSRIYTRTWQHPRRVRVLTPADMQLLARYCIQRGHQFAPLRLRR